MRRAMALALGLALGLALALGTMFSADLSAQDADPRLEALKDEALEMVDGQAKLVQEIVDHLFSFGELGMQEFETQRYLTELLEENGFEIELGVAGMPSAWTAKWGSGSPVIALGSGRRRHPTVEPEAGCGLPGVHRRHGPRSRGRT